MTNIEPNVLTTISAILLTGLVTFLVNRFGKSADAREAAGAALMGLGPAIIQEQNKRIITLNDQIDKLWARDAECREELATALARILLLEQRTAILP